jgi:hypothetical protein
MDANGGITWPSRDYQAKDGDAFLAAWTAYKEAHDGR